MVKGHHLQFKCHPLLFCNFTKFKIKATPAYHSIIQKEVNELLTKGVIEPSTGSTYFYSNIFATPMCTGGLWSYSALKYLIVLCTY